MMYNPRQLFFYFFFHFLTFAHFINTIFSFFISKEGLKRKRTMGWLIFHFLPSFPVQMVITGTLIRNDMIEFLGGSSFLECCLSSAFEAKFWFWLKRCDLGGVSIPTRHKFSGLTFILKFHIAPTLCRCIKTVIIRHGKCYILLCANEGSRNCWQAIIFWSYFFCFCLTGLHLQITRSKWNY